ncbi:mechanosensitive ion channel [candidate division KSB1 bacterium]|nr:mechanosensitive ion channel [candidate division KSB1 bacterium]
MHELWKTWSTLEIWNVPLTAFSISLLIILFTFLLKRFISRVLLNYLKRIVEKTETDIDDLLLQTVQRPLQLAIVGVGFYFARLFIIGYINDAVNAILNQGFQLFFIIIICLFLYRSADFFLAYLQKLAKRTHTQLDDLLLPYLKKVLRVMLIIIIIIKFAEIFLGMSVAAILGVLGGMGLTLGLVFKDIIANWFGCAVIYMDNLFQEGDWVSLDSGSIIDADVEEIGLRSTRFRNFDKTVSIVPNDTIARAIVKNWSRMHKRRVKFNVRLDGISSSIVEKLVADIRAMLADDNDVHQEFHMVNFREIDGNSRVIRLYYFTKTTVWKEHEQVRENINLKLLKLFETHAIERLAYIIVDLSDDRPEEYAVNGGEVF